jgi:hypothetical protein
MLECQQRRGEMGTGREDVLVIDAEGRATERAAKICEEMSSEAWTRYLEGARYEDHAASQALQEAAARIREEG